MCDWISGVPLDGNLRLVNIVKTLLQWRNIIRRSIMSALLCLLHKHLRRAWIQSRPRQKFCVNQTSKLLVWQSARSPASEHWQCRDYSLCSFVSNASSFYCHRSNTNHKRCQRSSACERMCACVSAHDESQLSKFNTFDLSFRNRGGADNETKHHH